MAITQRHVTIYPFSDFSYPLPVISKLFPVIFDILWLFEDLKATMGPFAGWDMPMIYKGVSIPDSVKVSLEFKCDRESKIQT